MTPEPFVEETPIDPQRPIVDAHHHLYDRPGSRYLLDDLLADLESGHRIVSTVLVQARHGYATEGDVTMRPVGETRFAVAQADRAAAGVRRSHGVASAIVPFANLMRGEAVRPVLEAHVSEGGGRVRGIRHITAWHGMPALLNPAYPTTEAMMESDAFRWGVRALAPLGLSFDAWVLFPQLTRFAALARACPDTAMVLDHCGGPMLGGPYAGLDREVFDHWRNGLRRVADCPNVMIKLSGLGMPSTGFGFDTAPRPASSSQALAAAWRPWMETCVALFGAERAMFASNFPADRPSYAYATGWNAMKHVAAGASEAEKDSLFRASASRFYRLGQGPRLTVKDS